MSTSKQKPPKIDLRLLARQRLNTLFDRHGRGELDMDGLQASVQALMGEVGHRPVLDALVKRIEHRADVERETLMDLVPRLRSREVIEYLWQQVKKPGALAVDAKLTVLVMLKDMGEEVDLADPGRYFSPREIRPSDITSAQAMLRLGLRGLARSLREARDPAEVEAFMLRINRMPEEAIDDDAILLELVANAEAEANNVGADFLHALAHTTPFPRVQQAAERALTRLAAAGIRPVTPAILRLGQDRFYAAYMTDPEHPWQQSVTVAWERAGGVIQALVFLLDFGFPWRGAIKDMFATQGLTPQRFQKELIERAEKRMGERLYRVSLARAQATIAAAVQANQQYHIPLPKEFKEVRHLVERWVLHPPAAAIEADATRDELAGRPLVPDRSSRPLLVDMRDLEHDETFIRWMESQLEEGDEEEAFNDVTEVLDDVEATFEELEYNVAWLQAEWVRDYLTSLGVTGVSRGAGPGLTGWIRDRLTHLGRRPEGLEQGDERLKLIVEHWLALRDFFEYLDDGPNEIHTPADLRGFHIVEYLSEGPREVDEDQGLSRVKVLHCFFAYLAERGLVPDTLPLLPDLAQMIAEPDTIPRLARPDPLGGEIAVWLPQFGDDEHEEPLTYNEWWMALVLEKKFKRNWDKIRRVAAKKPDAAAKLALLDRLENRLAEDAEYLDDLGDERPPSQADYRRAGRWFERENVSEDRAW